MPGTHWTDKEIKDLQNEFKRGVPWNQISHAVPRHSPSSCNHRYIEILRRDKATPTSNYRKRPAKARKRSTTPEESSGQEGTATLQDSGDESDESVQHIHTKASKAAQKILTEQRLIRSTARLHTPQAGPSSVPSQHADQQQDQSQENQNSFTGNQMQIDLDSPVNPQARLNGSPAQVNNNWCTISELSRRQQTRRLRVWSHQVRDSLIERGKI